jgi:hypothetical protein
LDNYQEYIEKVIKPIAKEKYRDKIKKRKRNRLRKKKKKKNKTDLLIKKQRDHLRFLITP